MKIVLIAVCSLNGKITKGEDKNIYKWTSREDKELFFSLIDKHNLIVMGRRTYEAAKDNIKLRQDKLRVVLTRDPQKYTKEEVKGILEFSKKSPRQVIQSLEKRGYKEMLLVGGGETNTLFMRFSLVNEIHLTLEPV